MPVTNPGTPTVAVQEIWKPIPNAEYYEVSNMGRVRSYLISGHKGKMRKSPKLLNSNVNHHGYCMVYIVYPNGKRNMSVSSIVLELFVGPRPSRESECCHNNGVRSDNRLENLRWDTPSSNNMDKYRHGTMPHGENHYLSVLNKRKVKYIRRVYSEGSVTFHYLARKFGVKAATIRDVVLKKTWKYVG